jgi:hypothetical protein
MASPHSLDLKTSPGIETKRNSFQFAWHLSLQAFLGLSFTVHGTLRGAFRENPLAMTVDASSPKRSRGAIFLSEHLGVSG